MNNLIYFDINFLLKDINIHLTEKKSYIWESIKVNVMIFFNFNRIFKIKGIVRPFSHLLKMGYSAGYATKLVNNRVNEINLTRLEKFCTDFNCTPNDILDFRPSENVLIPEDHALHSLTKKEVNTMIIQKINALPPDKIQQIHDIIKNME